MAAGFGVGTGELIAEAMSNRLDRSAVRIRTVIEASWLGVGAVLGGPLGPGTLIVALLIGPAVAHGVRMAEPIVNARPVNGPAVRCRPAERTPLLLAVGGLAFLPAPSIGTRLSRQPEDSLTDDVALDL